jgi:hypothetical protein
VYFTDRAIPYLEDDSPGIDSTLFGDILYISRVGTFLLDAMVSGPRPTPQFMVVNHSDSHKPMASYLQREIPLISFDAISIHMYARSIPLYFISESIDDSQLISMD